MSSHSETFRFQGWTASLASLAAALTTNHCPPRVAIIEQHPHVIIATSSKRSPQEGRWAIWRARIQLEMNGHRTCSDLGGLVVENNLPACCNHGLLIVPGPDHSLTRRNSCRSPRRECKTSAFHSAYMWPLLLHWKTLGSPCELSHIELPSGPATLLISPTDHTVNYVKELTLQARTNSTITTVCIANVDEYPCGGRCWTRSDEEGTRDTNNLLPCEPGRVM